MSLQVCLTQLLTVRQIGNGLEVLLSLRLTFAAAMLPIGAFMRGAWLQACAGKPSTIALGLAPVCSVELYVPLNCMWGNARAIALLLHLACSPYIPVCTIFHDNQVYHCLTSWPTLRCTVPIAHA